MVYKDMNDASSDYHGTLRTETLVTGSVPDVGFSPAPVVSPAGGDSTAATEDRGKKFNPCQIINFYSFEILKFL